MSINPYEASQQESNPIPKSFPMWAGYLATVFAVVLCGGLLYAVLVLPFARRGDLTAVNRSRCDYNLRLIGVGLHNYHSVYHTFPPAYTVDAEGKPLHSWRTLILPYIEQKELYDTIDLSKPWDDPVNAKALATHVTTYHCRELIHNAESHNLTNYFAIVGPDAAFDGSQSRKRSDFKDDPASTLMVIEAPIDKAVPWMSPQAADETLILGMNEKSDLSHKKTQEFGVVLADSSATFLKANLPADKRRAMISINGGEQVKLDK